MVGIDGLKGIREWYWMVSVVYACISGDNGSDPPRFGEIGVGYSPRLCSEQSDTRWGNRGKDGGKLMG